ncbi:MAG: hypothetical protein INF79_01555 [Roseomonas sp.]|nr:hypothetical protein [Roseomonas sp.]
MVNSNGMVAAVEEVAPAGERKSASPKVSVKLSGDETVLLNTKSPLGKHWMAVLRSLCQNKLPVYLEIHPTTKEITQLLTPRAVKVARVSAREGAGDVDVALIISERLHLLSRSHPNFSANLAKLQRAMKTDSAVLVTEDQNGDQIIDVRPIPKHVTIPGYLAIPRSRKPLKSRAKGGAK